MPGAVVGVRLYFLSSQSYYPSRNFNHEMSFLLITDKENYAQRIRTLFTRRVLFNVEMNNSVDWNYFLSSNNSRR